MPLYTLTLRLLSSLVTPDGVILMKSSLTSTARYAGFACARSRA